MRERYCTQEGHIGEMGGGVARCAGVDHGGNVGVGGSGSVSVLWGK